MLGDLPWEPQLPSKRFGASPSCRALCGGFPVQTGFHQPGEWPFKAGQWL